MIEKFVKGELTCGEIKQILFEKLNEMFNKIRDNKEKNVNKELIESFRLEKEKNQNDYFNKLNYSIIFLIFDYFILIEIKKNIYI